MSSQQATVLVIDDEAQIRRFLRAGFEIQGYKVLEAESGGAGIREATLRPVDLIVVDLGLPDIDGAEVVERSGPGPPLPSSSSRSSRKRRTRSGTSSSGPTITS